MPRRSSRSVLQYDAFFGRRETARRAGPFALAHLVPTVPEEEVEPHAHAEAHLVLVLAGRYISSARGAREVEGPGCLIYNPPGTEHRDRFRGEGGAFFTVSVPAGDLHALADTIALPDRPVLLRGETARLARSLAGRARSECEPLAIESLGFELLDRLARRAGERERWRPRWLARVRDRLREECADAPSMTELAGSAGVHPVHLTRVFREHFGCTPGDFLRRRRLDRAAALLAVDTHALSEVALACGYYDQAHFSNAFKRAFGVTPREYRTDARSRRPADR